LWSSNRLWEQPCPCLTLVFLSFYMCGSWVLNPQPCAC
jgi:hypothetical protein